MITGYSPNLMKTLKPKSKYIPQRIRIGYLAGKRNPRGEKEHEMSSVKMFLQLKIK